MIKHPIMEMFEFVCGHAEPGGFVLHLENLPNRFKVPIRPDKGGYLGRECPVKTCKGYFKITPGPFHPDLLLLVESSRVLVQHPESASFAGRKLHFASPASAGD